MNILLACLMACLAPFSAALASVASVANNNDNCGQAQMAPVGDEKWSGTASATCVCKDGQCKEISCSVSGAASYEDAKRQLKADIEAKVSNENGKVQGQIRFNISKSFN